MNMEDRTRIWRTEPEYGGQNQNMEGRTCIWRPEPENGGQNQHMEDRRKELDLRRKEERDNANAVYANRG